MRRTKATSPAAGLDAMVGERPIGSALVVDDEPAVCAVMGRQLRGGGFDVVEALDANEARGELAVRSFDVVICDLKLGSGSGLELAREVREQDPSIALVIVSGEGGLDAASSVMAMDVDEYLVKPFSGEQLAIAVTEAFRRRGEQAEARERVAETKALVADNVRATAERAERAEQTLDRLARAGRFRDEETAEHVERMSRACALIGRVLGMTETECLELRSASTLHDLGKVGVPDAVLRKPGRLNSAERELIECHPQIGHEILAGSEDPTMHLAATIALTHHERIDGQGYPRGLEGDEIPLPGRIAAVADVFDALTHDRIYRQAFAVPDALEIMRHGRGSQFDPQVLDAFESVLPEIEEVYELYPDGGGDEPAAPVHEAPVRVLIVDDHDALARGIEILLRREGLEVAGSARTLTAARGLLERRPVDVAVIDIALGADSGLDLVADAKAQGVRSLLYTGLVDAETIANALNAGADGVAAKAGSPTELIEAIRAVARGETHFDQRLERTPGRASPKRRLTRREDEIVGLLAGGLNGEEIARRLFISPETVRTHVRNAMNRMGARTRPHLIALAGPVGSEVSSGRAADPPSVAA